MKASNWDNISVCILSVLCLEGACNAEVQQLNSCFLAVMLKTSEPKIFLVGFVIVINCILEKDQT